MKTIKGLLLSAAIVFSLAVFGSIYYVASEIYERSAKEDAIAASNTLAQVTFNSMFQLMSTGWTRAQLEGFLAGMKKAVADTHTDIDIYRGDKVTALFGPINQKKADEAINKAFATGQSVMLADDGEGGDDDVRYVFPLKAQAVCQRCHVNAAVGDVLGVIDVRQRISSYIQANKQKFVLAFVPIVPGALVLTLLMVGYINRRIGRSIEALESDIKAINRISDLKKLGTGEKDFGFREFSAMFREIRTLTEKLRTVAVDKDMLEFEIKLLDRFIITSEVVRDWHGHVNRLLLDINNLTPAYAMFTVFKVGNELSDLDVFWRNSPSEPTRANILGAINETLGRQTLTRDASAVQLVQAVADVNGELPELSAASVQIHTKMLMVAAPEIGGVVGVCVQPDRQSDSMRVLVIESILSTLLNVVGSVKAIQKYTRELEYYATRDPLTDLFNQRVFLELLEYEIQRAKRHGYKFSVLMLDLDNFKSVNDSHGHAFGDRLLQELAGCMRGAVRSGDVLARYGGDEFVAILPETGLHQAAEVAQRMLDLIAGHTVAAPNGTRVKGSVSVGIAVYPDHATERKDLFLFADNMMYRAKAEGKSRVAVPNDQDVVEVFRSVGERSLIILNAIEEQRVVPYFQPILDLGTGRVEALEVLARIRPDKEQVITAEDFVSLAEKMGVMHKLDFILMEKALEAVVESGYQGLVFLNMSPRALVLDKFASRARRIASVHGVDPSRIVFEITERETIKNIGLLEKFIHDLGQEGFKLAIDDFGSGFSSFHYVKHFPIDFLKIEGEFVLAMLRNPRDKALVKSMVTLAMELGIFTVAEHVESPEVLAEVRAQGIDLAQGYHVGRPAPQITIATAGPQLAPVAPAPPAFR